ncbi:MAG: biotin--[acetyl-CoA-carboxylase] ligase [Alphaproteobacteria bacterium]|nr:biotin--[acetyl-CoA-carboxylase] ligase [Alphaproteobacteria bacterium]MBT5541174.1 biotin--[acetyl-CoA-carboxylase] ligase [Alphaproteobacteria bacterium]
MPPHFVLKSYGTVESTNDIAKGLIEDPVLANDRESIYVVCAKSQTKGRGRLGREWVSPEGNLYASFLLRQPTLVIAQMPQLSFVAAIAVGKAIETFSSENINLQYKWPNDVIVNGKKVGGILVESDFQETSRSTTCIVGIGVNLIEAPQKALFPAGCLKEEIQKLVTVDDFLPVLCKQFWHFYTLWLEQGFLPIRDEWLKRAYALGSEISLRAPHEENGTLVGLNEVGALILKTEAGPEKLIHTGEITNT